MKIVFLFTLCFVLASGDVNLHNPPGSNNRLDETGRNRANANRLFDSQNNNRGGSNVGTLPNWMTYIAGTKIRVEWANQHSCGDENNNCEVVLQYMCGENVRDGTTLRTPPTDTRQCDNEDCNTDKKFGQHEDLEYYYQCLSRERNKGLFTADQRLHSKSAKATRQNANGQRRGYECPEERDYYPYWHPTPWKDIAVFTNNQSRCDYYKKESYNVKSRFHCAYPAEYWKNLKQKDIKVVLPITQGPCESSSTILNGVQYNGEWVEAPSHGIDPPDCLTSQWSRDNHQGNTIGGEFLHYDWTLPDIDEDHCVLRIRYNISTGDFPAWDTTTCDDPNPNKGLRKPSIIYSRFGLSDDDANRRQYYLRGDPKVAIFDKSGADRFRLQVALNTAQYGRTFQDRTHTFRIKPRPEELIGETIHNINVRGKRGNIVQVYPSVEYDFVPNNLTVNVGDYIQFQWTGSDRNFNSDGQGKRGTDRNNVIQLKNRTFTDFPLGLSTNYPDADGFLGFSQHEIYELALGYPGVSATLDDRVAYFNSGPLKVQSAGTFYYMCTRNNNFSNRDQKGVIIAKNEV